ncbi:MAG: ABC transporter ATP-binding protein [Actinomycetota bacterium]|nr:ABC transporter ATP-binding protein [Actinomycetota bacterium]
MLATDQDQQPAILCRDLVRIFTAAGVEVQALQGLNLRVEPGELVGIVGESGSGKSTLLSILAGLDSATAGSAVVGGLQLAAMSVRQRLGYQRSVVGFVWQQTSRNLLGYLTASENIAIVLRLQGRRARAARISELLSLLDVGDCVARHPAEMSGGQQQRVAIAVALANRPKVLLADEPTGELDETTSAAVLETIRATNAALGVTTVIVTHDPAVSDHVQRTIRIRDGRTSTEVLRHISSTADGAQTTDAREFAVLDSVGRLQLPAEYVNRLDLIDRVRLVMESDHVGIWPAAEQPEPEPVQPGQHATKERS